MRDCNIVLVHCFVNTSPNLLMESNCNKYQAYQMTIGLNNRVNYD